MKQIILGGILGFVLEIALTLLVSSIVSSILVVGQYELLLSFELPLLVSITIAIYRYVKRKPYLLMVGITIGLILGLGALSLLLRGA
jgi:hypothetical protein